MKNSSWLSLFLVAAIACLPGCGNNDEAKQQVATPPEKVTSVSCKILERQDVREIFTLPANLEAWEDLVLAAEQAGPVRWIGPQEGDRLQKGEAILRIDPETLEANLARDKADFDYQQSHFQRMKRLVEKKLVSQQEYEDSRLSLKVAEAKLRTSEVALQKSTLKSPVAGVLDQLMVDRGEYVGMGDPMALVVQVDRLKVLVDIPEKDIGYLQVGQKVDIRPAVVNTLVGERLDGEIVHLALKADPVTRTYRAKIVVDNSSGKLRPGMIVRVEFLRRSLQQVLTIPLYALVDREGVKVAFVKENGVARMRKVAAGGVIDGQVLISEGLVPGECLIVSGQQLLSDGMPVAEAEE